MPIRLVCVPWVGSRRLLPVVWCADGPAAAPPDEPSSGEPSQWQPRSASACHESCVGPRRSARHREAVYAPVTPTTWASSTTCRACLSAAGCQARPPPSAGSTTSGVLL
eukprot:scaffold9992_cov64-Phaeocystis_antarctica.AAC.3